MGQFQVVVLFYYYVIEDIVIECDVVFQVVDLQDDVIEMFDDEGLYGYLFLGLWIMVRFQLVYFGLIMF